MFIYGFGDYTVFIEVECRSSTAVLWHQSRDGILTDRAIILVPSRRRDSSSSPSELLNVPPFLNLD
jgi:hypothetical protein